MRQTLSPLFLSAIAFMPVFSIHAGETLVIPSLVVRDAPVVSSQLTGLDGSLASYLVNTPGVRVLQQGAPGGSADLSIRGSAFSGAGLSMGGVALRNPQTEHFHAELPFPAWWFAAPVLRTGASQAAQGEGHLAGTVALSPLPMRDRRVFSAGVDQEGGFKATAGLQYTQETLHRNTFGLGAFGGFTDLPNVDNLGNDLESVRAGVQMQYLSDFGQGDVWFGWQEKTFGARGFYGVNPDFDAEETTRDMMLIGLWRSLDPDRPYDFGVSIREFQDEYTLDLPGGVFRNEHTTNVRSAQGGVRLPFTEDNGVVPTDFFGVTLRASVDQEEINSTNLGNRDRYRFSGTVLPDLEPTDGIRFFAGIRGEVYEDFDDQVHPLARMEFTPNVGLFFYVDYAQSARQPSYTELNYESPASLGNAGLDLQTQESLEVGMMWNPTLSTAVSLAVFRHVTKDTVDWIRENEEATRWQAENIGRVETRGIEALVRHAVHQDLDVSLGYTWLDKEADDEPYASRYVLDYAEHQIQVLADWRASPVFRVEAAQSWLSQVDNPLRDRGGDTQWLTSLAVHARPTQMPNVQFSLTGSNLFDDDFRVFAGQDTYSERRFSASVSVEW